MFSLQRGLSWEGDLGFFALLYVFGKKNCFRSSTICLSEGKRFHCSMIYMSLERRNVCLLQSGKSLGTKNVLVAV